jgi:hypothetical protein
MMVWVGPAASLLVMPGRWRCFTMMARFVAISPQYRGGFSAVPLLNDFGDIRFPVRDWYTVEFRTWMLLFDPGLQT